MYQARTENDAKVTELHFEMRDMIVVLCQYVCALLLFNNPQPTRASADSKVSPKPT
jgi:hypothetical protein